MFVLSEDGTRTRGSDAQRSNVAAGRAIAEAVDVVAVAAETVDVVDLASVKTKAITAATEAATMLVRIDDVIAAN